MSTFIIIPKFRDSMTMYNAPTMFIEAANQNEAQLIADNCSLARFNEWTFHVGQYQERRKTATGIFIDKTDSKSKSQIGKRKNSMQLSRPQRRALRRTQMGNYSDGCKQTTKFKCW